MILGRSGREAQKEGMYAYLELIRVIVWQKPTQHGKTILQLKIDVKKKKRIAKPLCPHPRQLS